MMLQKVNEVLKKYPKDKYYIVGVSGGCDSMCLLDILVKNGYKVVVCHVNYNLRHDTDEDYKVVNDYCTLHHIPMHYKEITEHSKDNFQQFARNARYDFYLETGKIYGTNQVFLGHHKDDVLETILMQKERKSEHISWGINETSKVRDNHVIRIMLDISKSEILDYCKENHISYHDDYTNFETHFKRDYIRNVVLKNMSETQKEEILLESKIHNTNLQNKQYELGKILDNVIRNSRLYFNEIPQKYFKEVIREYLYLNIPTKRISESLVDEVVKELKRNQPNIEIPLPVNLRFIKEYDNGYIQINKQITDYEYQFEQFALFECDYFKLDNSGEKNCGIYLDESMYPIKIRNFRSGDVIAMKFGHKKVNRLFIDHKIPAKLRKVWPIVTDKDDNIVLIPNIAKNLSQMDTKPNVFVVELISKILEECQYA